MAKRISNYKIKSFPADGRIWRLGWFGKLGTNPNVLSEPSIDVILIPLRSNDITKDTNLNSLSSYAKYQIKTFNVGSGLFPILRLGSFWLDGKEKCERAY